MECPPPTRSRSSSDRASNSKAHHSWQLSATAFSSSVSMFMVSSSAVCWFGFLARSVACTERTVKVFRRLGKSLLTGVCFRARLKAESGSLSLADRIPVGTSMDEFDAQLDALEQELRRNIASPPADLPAFLDDWLKRLRGVPFTANPKRRVALLIDAASQYYLHGQKSVQCGRTYRARGDAGGAKGEQTQLRRALSIQGLILTATRNTPDALRSLMQALDIAERTRRYTSASQPSGCNIGVTFLEATLYTDARVMLRASRIARSDIDDDGLQVRQSRSGSLAWGRSMQPFPARVPARVSTRARRRSNSLLASEGSRTGAACGRLIEATYCPAAARAQSNRRRRSACGGRPRDGGEVRRGSREDFSGDSQWTGRGLQGQRRRRHLAHRRDSRSSRRFWLPPIRMRCEHR